MNVAICIKCELSSLHHLSSDSRFHAVQARLGIIPQAEYRKSLHYKAEESSDSGERVASYNIVLRGF